MSAASQIQVRTSNTFTIPDQFSGLVELAYNLRWSWNESTQHLFESLQPEVWKNTKNPVMVLNAVHDYSHVIENKDFIENYKTELKSLKDYMSESEQTWYGQKSGKNREDTENLAYFCAEYGIHESFPGYSGGLGILAGDHCKAASDMNMPFTAVGLLYRNGYFRQVIDPDGRQEHNYPEFVTRDLPIFRVQDAKGQDQYVNVQIADRQISCGIWLAKVGRIPLYLLDTNNERNSAEDREITRLLYVRGREMRLAQEIVLGVGGVRALEAMNVKPAAWHLNEGHSAFMIVERLGKLVNEKGLSFTEAAKEIEKKSVFTIHTPVPAGNEVFDVNLVKSFAKPIFEAHGLNEEDVLSHGTGIDGSKGAFDMTAFCLRMANHCNGVSQLHGETAHGTWNKITGRNIGGVTNGVHMPTWLGQHVQKMLTSNDMNLNKLDLAAVDTEAVQKHINTNIDKISNDEFWSTHNAQKTESFVVIKNRLRDQLSRNGADPQSIADKLAPLVPNILTVGFARRFATYKRAALLFTDPERLTKILNNSQRPVQLLFAGKAHPADKPGQALIQDIVTKVQNYKLDNRIFFVEDYDMQIGRALVQGTDIWLNNPRRPLEASGTSGMKAAANGIPNVSILDGWWDEGYEGNNGWAIGSRDSLENDTLQDKNDAESLYALLEGEVTQKYYAGEPGQFSEEWISVMKKAMSSSLFTFATTRMLSDYYNRMYTEAGLK